jgi:hypothetical protein
MQKKEYIQNNFTMTGDTVEVINVTIKKETPRNICGE